jgi:hypothetical protein
MNKKHLISKFYKNKPSFYKLSNNQIKQLLDYLKFEINPEELNNAIGYTSRCPYCFSENIYKTENKSHLYKFKCENCNKKFTSLSKSVISDLLLEEYINRGEKLFYKEALKNIEVWLCFDVQHDRRYKNIPRENIVGNISDWRYNLLKLSHNLKNEHLVSIHVQSQESFYKLLDFRISEKNKKKFRENRNKRFIVLTFQEGSFTPKQSLNDFGKKLMKYTNSFQSYQDDVQKKKVVNDYENLKNNLIQSYNNNCEHLSKPNREDKIYKDIECSFKHTYSLAYEMAIRNSKVKKILYALKYLKNIEKNLNDINHKDNVIYNKTIKKFKNELPKEYPYYLDKRDHEKYLKAGLYIINSLIKDFETTLREEYLIIPKENKVKTPESNRILIQRAIYSEVDKYKWYSNIPDEENDISKYDYTIKAGIFKDSDVFDVNVIRANFSLNIIDKNAYYIPINFNLPIEEIEAYIKKIKQDSLNNKELIKSPMAVLEEELDELEDENVELYIKKTFNDKLKSMANALFAYDLFQFYTQENKKLESEQDKLKNELNELQNKYNKEIKPYKKAGPKTKHEKLMKRRIDKKFEEINFYNEHINSIENTLKANNENILIETKVKRPTFNKYLEFMDKFIEDKYIKNFL